jgi:D-sedoheptulose 7-phosphate isomerase
VLNAAAAARALGMRAVALTGPAGSELAALADVAVCCPAGPFADRVQELHLKVVHVLIELVERHFHPGLYAGAG